MFSKTFYFLLLILAVISIAYAQNTAYFTQAGSEDLFIKAGSTKQFYDNNNNKFYAPNGTLMMKTPISLASIVALTGEELSGEVVAADMLKIDYDPDADAVVIEAGKVKVEDWTQVGGQTYEGLYTDETDTAKVLKPDGSGDVIWGTDETGGDLFGPASSTSNELAVFHSTTGKIVKNSGLIVTNSGDNPGYILKSDGSGNLTLQPDADSGGDVTGPVSSLDNEIALFNSTSGKIIKKSGMVFPSSDGVNTQVLQTNGSGTLSWTDNTGGGGSLPSGTQGDIITYGTTWEVLNHGTNGQVLTSNGTTVSWGTPSSSVGDLNDLSDVNVSTAEGTMAYRDASGNLVSVAPSVSSGYMLKALGGSGTIPGWANVIPTVGLGDIILGNGSAHGTTNLSNSGINGQVLTISSGTPAWVNPSSGSSTMFDLTDVNETSSSIIANQVLRWSGAPFDYWEGIYLNLSGLEDVSLSNSQKGDILTYTETFLGLEYRNLKSGTSGQVLSTTGTTLEWINNSSSATTLNDLTDCNLTTTQGTIAQRDVSGNLVGLEIGTTGQFLKSDGTDAEWASVSVPAINDITDVNISTTQSTIPYRDSAGNLVGLPIGTTGKVLTSNGAGVGPSWESSTSTISAINNVGDVNIPTTLGTIPYRDASGNLVGLAGSTSGKVLQTNGVGTIPTWETVGAGSVAAINDVGDVNIATTHGTVAYRNSAGALVGLDTGTSGQFLKTNGVGSDPSWDTATATVTAINDVGDVNISTDAGTVVTRNTTGDLVGVAPGTSGYVFTTNGAGVEPTWQDVAVNEINDIADVNIATTTGTIGYRNSTGNFVGLIAGANGYLLQSNGAGTIPSWEDVAPTEINDLGDVSLDLSLEGGIAYVTGTTSLTTLPGTLSTNLFLKGGSSPSWSDPVSSRSIDDLSDVIFSGVHGAIMYGDTYGNLAELSPGTSGYVLQTNGIGSNPSWVVQSGNVSNMPNKDFDFPAGSFDYCNGVTYEVAPLDYEDVGSVWRRYFHTFNDTDNEYLQGEIKLSDNVKSTDRKLYFNLSAYQTGTAGSVIWGIIYQVSSDFSTATNVTIESTPITSSSAYTRKSFQWNTAADTNLVDNATVRFILYRKSASAADTQSGDMHMEHFRIYHTQE